jgi:hypothetical protein
VQQRFELGEELLDRVEVWAVGRQEEQLGAGRANDTSYRLALVAAEVVDDDDVAGAQRGRQHLLDIGEKALPVDRPVDDAGSIDPIVAQYRQKVSGRQRPCGTLGHQPFAARRTAVGARHIGLRPGLVDEDEARRVKPALVFLPLRAAAPRRGDPARWRAGFFFEADPFVLEEVPDRVVAHLDPTLRQLRRDNLQRDVRLLGQPRQKPGPLACQRVGPPPAHLVGRRASGRAEPLRPLHNARNADLERLRNRSAGLSCRHRLNHTLAQIQRVGSGHRMLASIPASILNQSASALGILIRFRNPQSRSLVSPASELQSVDKGIAFLRREKLSLFREGH